MLDENYASILEQLIQRIQWDIRLPPMLADFFDQRGPAPTMPHDTRIAVRLRARTQGVLFPTAPLSAFPRPKLAMGIYTSDFSKYGFGFIASEQFWPEEEVRVVLQTFWMKVKVVRCRCLGPKCYEMGCDLIRRENPSLAAFSFS
jgi:hypothetical protein